MIICVKKFNINFYLKTAKNIFNYKNDIYIYKAEVSIFTAQKRQEQNDESYSLQQNQKNIFFKK